MQGYEVLFQGNNFLRLLGGLWVTVRIALISIVFSIILGIFLGTAMRMKNRAVRAVCRVYLEFVRIMPQLVLLFIAFFGIVKLTGISLDGETASIIVFTIWGTAEMGDLVRSAFSSVPKHQYESAEALGLNKFSVYLYVILPQAVRSLIPNLINLSMRMIQTTAFVSLIGVTEVLKVGKQIIDANRYDAPNAALWVYGTIFLMYFVICFPLSMLSRQLARKIKRS
ncbi:MAG: amino acid ABC transporter permease [Oscillospiraceae bacterium]|nr:amino acid ABC transporter permease [Oscillospiraceae bacterium]